MVSSARIWSVVIVAAISAFISGCTEDGSRSGVIEPWDDEPMILESVLCLDVDGGRPAGIADVFLESDERVYVWIFWINIENGSTIEVAWFEPGEDLPFLEEAETVSSSADSLITWFSIDKPSGGFDRGEWSVDIYLDGEFERSHLFMVE